MGEVYRARDTRLGRFVAVKVLPADVASDPNRRKRVFVSDRRGESGLHRINLDGTGLKSLTGSAT